MRQTLDLLVIASCSLCIVAGCAGGVDVDRFSTASATLGCGLGDEVVTTDTITPSAIPGLSTLQRAQIIAAVHESVHTDATTIDEAFAVVDDHELNLIVLHDTRTNQFYLEVEFGAGGNSYGAIFYWNTAVEGAAIHDGFQEECGPLTFNYDQGDVAPACTGLLDYASTASFAALDAYLPSNVAQAIVDARAAAPFTSVASVVAVNGVAETRLQQLLSATRSAGLVGASCSGIDDQIAVSVDEAAAIVALVNQASANELHGILAFLINQTVVGDLVAARPFATAGAVSATSRVGTATFRALRNAASFRGPFEDLVDAIDAIDRPDHQIRFARHFDWVPLVTGATGFSSMDCFGLTSSQVPVGATLRPSPAGGNELMESAGEGVALASAFDALSLEPTPGLTDLEGRTTGHSFFGCYVSYHPNPFVFDRQAIFVDTATGASLLITSHDVE
jgi:hypothetical protein